MPTFFQSVTIDERDCVLVVPGIDWSVRPKISRVFSTIDEDGRSGVEARASEFYNGRLALSYHYTLETAEAEEFRDTLLQLGTDLLAMPIELDRLPAADYTADLRIFAPQHYVNYDAADGSYQIDGSGGHPETAGLVLCRLVDVPRRKLLSDTAMRVTLSLEEDAPWDARVGINSLTMNAWDLLPDWAMPVEELSKWQLQRHRLGGGRESALKGEDAPMKVGQQAGFTLEDRNAIRRVLTFWEAKRGAAVAFTAPLFLRPTWDGSPGEEPVIQARFGQDRLELDCSNQDQARIKLVFWEELLLTEGQPSQLRPSRGYAVKLWWAGSATVHAWTDWESPITIDSQAYTTRSLEVRPPVENLRPGTSEWEFMVGDFVGCPLRAYPLMRVERKLNIEIREFDPSDADGTARVRFAGTVRKAPRRDRVFHVQTVLFGGRLTALAPDSYCRTTCNNVVYDDLCALDPDTHKVVGTLDAINAAVIDVSGGASEADDYFAEGWVEVGTGDTQELRYVVRSETIAGGQRLTLNRPLSQNVLTAATALYPGCDGQYSGGCAKLSNQDNFYGAPWKPAYIEAIGTGATKIGK